MGAGAAEATTHDVHLVRGRAPAHYGRWRMAKGVTSPLAEPRLGGKDDSDIASSTAWPNGYAQSACRATRGASGQDRRLHCEVSLAGGVPVSRESSAWTAATSCPIRLSSGWSHTNSTPRHSTRRERPGGTPQIWRMSFQWTRLTRCVRGPWRARPKRRSR